MILAESEKELGIEKITDEAIRQMRDNLNVTDEEIPLIAAEEKRRRCVQIPDSFF